MGESVRTGNPSASGVLELAGLIYDAVSDASRWPAFLEAFARAVHADKGGLFIRDTSREDFAVLCWHGWSDEDIRLYAGRYAEMDPWHQASSRWPEGEAGSDFELCPRAEMEVTPAYREFYAPRGAVHGMGATILITATGHSCLR